MNLEPQELQMLVVPSMLGQCEGLSWIYYDDWFIALISCDNFLGKRDFLLGLVKLLEARMNNGSSEIIINC
jgi:hypothetical protein